MVPDLKEQYNNLVLQQLEDDFKSDISATY
jgi:hypothetical protein